MSLIQDTETTYVRDPLIDQGRELKGLRRGDADVILQRCHALPEHERAVVRAIYERGQPAADVARVAGQGPRAFRRSLMKVVQRVLSQEFALVVARRSRWPNARRRVATAVFIHGLTVTQAAKQIGLTYYAARRHHDAVRAMIDGGEA